MQSECGRRVGVQRTDLMKHVRGKSNIHAESRWSHMRLNVTKHHTICQNKESLEREKGLLYVFPKV